MCICLHSRYIHMFGGVCTTHTDRYIRGRKKERETINVESLLGLACFSFETDESY